jgi:hypothetical protein
LASQFEFSACASTSLLRQSDTRIEGRAPVWGFEFSTKKAATQQGGSAEFAPIPCVVALGPVVFRARVLVHEVARAEELAERRL